MGYGGTGRSRSPVLLVRHLRESPAVHPQAPAVGLEKLGHKPVKSLKPYWDRNGKTFAEPDGYRVVRDRGRYNFVLEVMDMSGYVHPTEQLVTEIVVRDICRSVDFYERLGFTLLRAGGAFVELTWEDHRLYLAELSAYQLFSV